MKPTDEDIKAAKAEALARFGRDEVLVVDFAAPVSASVIVAPLNLARYCKLCDAQSRDMATSFGNVVLDALLWPEQDAWIDLVKKRAALPRRVVHQLLLRAGKGDGAAEKRPLADMLEEIATRAKEEPDAKAKVIPGLEYAKARALLDAEEKEDEPRELWCVWGPGLSCVMGSPDPEIFMAANVAVDRAREKEERVVEAVLDFTRGAIVWCDGSIDASLDDKPCVADDLKAAWQKMGGEVAEVTAKSF